jgi:hypothetical protein
MIAALKGERRGAAAALIRDAMLAAGGHRIRTTDGEAAFDAGRVHHVYGQGYALTFERTETPAAHTCLQIDAARASKDRRYDWQTKFGVQLQDHELIELLAVLRGARNEATFRNHGSARDKALTIRAQRDAGSFYVNLRRGEESRGVPVPVFHAYRVITLAVRVLRENEAGLTADQILAIVDGLAGRFQSGKQPA